MKKTLLRSLLLGACCAAPIAAMAGGLEAPTCCTPPRVDIPDMREGWGFMLEGAAIQPYNNNLAYASPLVTSTVGVAPLAFTTHFVDIEEVKPNYKFDLRVGVDYTLADSANVLKLTYEHFFNNDDSNDDDDDFVNRSVNFKFDEVTLASEQHILIGPYWEATLTGGLRWARVQQNSNLDATLIGVPADVITGGVNGVYGIDQTAKFNGVGPVGGVGSMFHLTENLALGAEGLVAILIGNSQLDVDYATDGIGFLLPVPTIAADVDTDSVTSVVPELFMRIYANYFYRFQDGMELQVEAGWRTNHFFNLRTGLDEVERVARASFAPEVNTLSDEISFSGPYLMGHLKI